MNATRAILAAGALALALLAGPEAARACAVCTGGDSAAVGWALFKSSLLLSLLPLAVVGGAVWDLRRRARQLAAAEARRAEGGSGAPAAPA